MTTTSADSQMYKVCLNENCAYYARRSANKFQKDFEHCPFCGGKMTTEKVAMMMLERQKKW